MFGRRSITSQWHVIKVSNQMEPPNRQRVN